MRPPSHDPSRPASAAPERIRVGRLTRTHGVRGDIKMHPDTDDVRHLDAVEMLYVGATPESARAYAVEALRAMPTKQGTTVLVRFKGIASPEAAEGLRGQGVYADATALPPLDADEYFLHDLVGLAAEDEAGRPLGRIVDVVEMPAHPVLVVETASGASVMVPSVPAFVADLDTAGGRIVLRPVEGLFDDGAETA